MPASGSSWRSSIAFTATSAARQAVGVESVVAGARGEEQERLAESVELELGATRLPTTSLPPG